MLQITVDKLVYGLLGLSPDSHFGGALDFFIYDSVKILLLLVVMITVIGFLRTFFPQDHFERWLSRRGLVPYILAALFGALTPFCSCSSIPIFLGFLQAGLPLGVTFSFLVTSPMINEYLVVLMIGFFGWKITLAYVASGLVIGVTVGAVLGRLKLEDHLADDFQTPPMAAADSRPKPPSGFADRWARGWGEAREIVQRVWGWVLAGVALGAVIHNYVPQEWIQGVIQKTGVWSVPLATLLGVPMYGSCAAIVPVAVVLFQKGIPLGTALAFMMATAALSLPESVILRRAMKLRLIAVFFGVTTAGIIFTGYLFNFLQHILY
jgi:hypothetical protein